MVYQESKHTLGIKTLDFRLALKRINLLFIFRVLCFMFLSNCCYAVGSKALVQPRNEIIEHVPFIQIPGPNPLISPGESSDWDGAVVEAGNVIKGPAIVEESTTTIVIPKSWTCRVDKYGNYFIRRK